ncbi:MAG: 50S ribosomal protein L29 [Candidatus Nealsonbacteria bacterium]|nr:50S ribosomal protein L29 [Candidatus Nealsonbacteria bacterium]
MKIGEIRQKPQKELQEILRDKQEKLRQLRFDFASGKVKNVREIQQIKKDIARILTIINNQDANIKQ